MRIARRLVLFAFAAGLTGAAALAPVVAQEQSVLVFAAASMKGPLDTVAADWTKKTGKQVKISYAASSALARQVEQGAPADLFVSADLDWMDWLQKRDLIKVETRKTLLANDLVLVAPLDSKATIKLEKGAPLAALIGDSKLATGLVDSVPAGKYAKQALTSLGVWDAVAPKVAGADNVRAALSLVARGEAAFGIVYGSDAKAEPKVKVVAVFPADSHPAILYPGAVLAKAPSPDAASLLDAIASKEGLAVFQAAGFSAPGK